MEALLEMVAVSLLVLSDLARGNPDPCTYKTVGDSVNILLNRSMDCQESSLTWKLNSTDIFRRRQTVRFGKPEDVTFDGWLQLKNLKTNDSGEYRGELYDVDGKLCGSASERLCVIERVSKPTVTYACSNATVTLNCNSEQWRIKWSENGKLVYTDLGKTVTLPRLPDHRDTYSCKAWNQVSQEESDNATILCPVQLSIKVMPQNVTEGEAVSILCDSNPPADHYILWTPRGEKPLSIAVEGEYKLKNVTKSDEGLYTCHPQWFPPRPGDETKATIALHVFSKKGIHPGREDAASLVSSATEQRFLLAVYSSVIISLSA
ncbi:hypothetical protein GJAV_G00134020 [Gymnothorax javanicus]|nr:hypothetical protein GJAV_G00134020 [Gymnothorax javanicus]